MSAVARVEQAVVLCGGLGSRLGPITASVPKPLLPVAGQPFLERLIFEIRRHGLKRILLLAAHMSSDIEVFARDTATRLDVTIEIAVEPDRAGTGGALWHAMEKLDKRFLLFNGDSWFDFNLLDLAVAKFDGSASIVAMALRRVKDGSRYGVVEVQGDRVTHFRAQGDSPEPALVNGGVYVVDRSILTYLQPICSFEHDVLQPLAQKGLITGRVYNAFFIDIGVPIDYERAQTEIAAHQRRGALFLDRDGVMNVDHGYVGEISKFDWLPGVKEAIKSLNDSGRFVFVVTNQAGVARGLYSEDAVAELHAHIERDLAAVGAHIDDFRYCPFHPDGSVSSYACASDWRKPAPGMLLDLMARWPVDPAQSIMIGDQESDVEAGVRAGLRACRIHPSEQLSNLLARTFPPHCGEAADGGLTLI